MALNTKSLAVVSFSLLLLSTLELAKAQVPIVDGLSLSFYAKSCPNLESIVRKRLQSVFKDAGLAAGVLRLQYHDCFVQGCDASLLLDGSAGGPSEKSANPNLTLRPQAFKVIEDLRSRVHKECGRVVSCADLVAIAARDAVVLTGGPNYNVPLGRRDGLTFATSNDTITNLVAPTANTTTLLNKLSVKNLTATDAVALSGAHTIGSSHCASFTRRLYPTQDPTMDQTFANNLKGICPALNTNRTLDMDIRSPNLFDNKYYVDLMNRQTLFTSDQDMYTDSRTRGIVTSFAVNQTLFFEEFVKSMLRMGQLSVLTGNSGEIRANCSARNSDNVFIASVVEDEGPGSSQF